MRSSTLCSSSHCYFLSRGSRFCQCLISLNRAMNTFFSNWKPMLCVQNSRIARGGGANIATRYKEMCGVKQLLRKYLHYIRDVKQITTATSTKMMQCACLELIFRRSAKSYNVKTCIVAQSLLREYKVRLSSYFFYNQ